jgi:hypothetical protein
MMHGQRNIKLNFIARFSKKTEISNFMKIRPVGADRQTGMTKLIVAFAILRKPPER